TAVRSTSSSLDPNVEFPGRCLLSRIAHPPLDLAAPLRHRRPFRRSTSKPATAPLRRTSLRIVPRPEKERQKRTSRATRPATRLAGPLHQQPPRHPPTRQTQIRKQHPLSRLRSEEHT